MLYIHIMKIAYLSYLSYCISNNVNNNNYNIITNNNSFGFGLFIVNFASFWFYCLFQ